MIYGAHGKTPRECGMPSIASIRPIATIAANSPTSTTTRATAFCRRFSRSSSSNVFGLLEYIAEGL